MNQEFPSGMMRFVRPIRIEIGGSLRNRDLVLLTIVFQLSPDDPEEFQLRIALDESQALYVSQTILEVLDQLDDSS